MRPDSTIYWLHGWASHGRVWEPLQQRLPAASHRCLSYADAVAGEPLRLIRELPAGAWLAGWSLGGMLAMAAAAEQPQLAGLILIGATLRFVDEAGATGWPPRVLQRMRRQLGRDPAPVLAAFSERLLPDAAARRRYHREVLLGDAMSGTDQPPATLAAGLSTLAALDLRAVAAALRCPILWLHGAADTICPAAALPGWRACLPAARFVVLPGAGHLPQWTEPDAVADAIQEWEP